MAEVKWPSCTDPHLLLRAADGRVSLRKQLRLAAICARRAWRWVPDHFTDTCLVQLEAMAEPNGGPVENGAMIRALEVVRCGLGQAAGRRAEGDYVEGCGRPRWVVQSISDIMLLARIANTADSTGKSRPLKERRIKERRRQRDMLLDIFGDPFAPPNLDRSCRTPAVLTLARAIDKEQTFGDLPILADALEDAGCTDEVILSHLRSGGHHVRGCWCVDLVLA